MSCNDVTFNHPRQARLEELIQPFVHSSGGGFVKMSDRRFSCLRSVQLRCDITHTALKIL